MYGIKTYHPPGTSPGTLIDREAEPDGGLTIKLIDYTEQDFVECTLASAAESKPYLESDTRTWIQVNGRPDPGTLRELGTQFGLHELALEDVLNEGQRPKLDIDDEQLFLITSLPRYDGEQLELVQICLFAGHNYIICFCSDDEDPFEPIRKRLRAAGRQRIRVRGADYLLYALIDVVIDAAFPVLEQLSEGIENLEDALLDRPSVAALGEIHRLRRDLLVLRRALWPQREAIGTLLRSDVDVVEDATRPYLRDCYDHSIQIMDLLESFREMASSLLDVYLSSVSQRTNETMRVLTIIATIFMPLTFIVGLYGMNFEHATSPWAMPELGWYYGYPIVMVVMLVCVGGMLWYFRRRGWL